MLCALLRVITWEVMGGEFKIGCTQTIKNIAI
jgi:hypothetical protein